MGLNFLYGILMLEVDKSEVFMCIRKLFMLFVNVKFVLYVFKNLLDVFLNFVSLVILVNFYFVMFLE